MAANNNVYKSLYFFNDGWNVDVDDILIKVLSDCHGNGDRFIREPTRKLLNTIIQRVSTEYDAVYPRSLYRSQIRKLRARVNCFDYIISEDGVKWDDANNFVDCSPEKWAALIQVHPLAEAYIHEGEEKWSTLMVIFSEDVDVQAARDTGLIVLSNNEDTTPATKKGKHIFSENSGESPLNPIDLDYCSNLSPVMVDHRKKMKCITLGLKKNLFGGGPSNVGDVAVVTTQVNDDVELKEDEVPDDVCDRFSSTASNSPFKLSKP